MSLLAGRWANLAALRLLPATSVSLRRAPRCRWPLSLCPRCRLSLSLVPPRHRPIAERTTLTEHRTQNLTCDTLKPRAMPWGHWHSALGVRNGEICARLCPYPAVCGAEAQRAESRGPRASRRAPHSRALPQPAQSSECSAACTCHTLTCCSIASLIAPNSTAPCSSTHAREPERYGHGPAAPESSTSARC